MHHLGNEFLNFAQKATVYQGVRFVNMTEIVSSDNPTIRFVNMNFIMQTEGILSKEMAHQSRWMTLL